MYDFIAHTTAMLDLLKQLVEIESPSHDKAGVDKAFGAARALLEYAPKLKSKVAKAYDRARDTLELIERFGRIDEKTGLPVAKEGQPAALEAP